MPAIPAGDITLHYDSYGAGEPLLLINGFGASSLGWRPEFLEALGRAYRVIAFDNRGTGRSDKPDQPTSIAQMADDAAGVLTALGINRAHVAGISMGGMIAQEVALRHPARVRGLVLGCTNHGGPQVVAAPPETVSLLMVPEGMDPREAARRAWVTGYTPAFIAANQDFLEAALERAFQHPTPVATRVRQMEAIRTWSTRDRLSAITAPTLVITGDADVLIPPANSTILHELIPGSRLHIIPGAAHVFPGSHPEESAAAIIAFLQEVDAAAPVTV